MQPPSGKPAQSNPISFSCIVDSKPVSSEDADLFSIQPRSLESWQDAETAEKCTACKDVFWLWGKHHCRHCGRTFCDGCTKKRAVIPAYIKIPIPEDKHREQDRSAPLRVCDACFQKLENLAQIASHIGPANNQTSLDVDHLTTLSRTAHDSLLKQWAFDKLSTFREIQYFLPDHSFSAEEREMLWVNRRHFIGHNKWFVQLLKSIDYMSANQDVLNEVDRLLDLSRGITAQNGGCNSNQSARPSCWKLMCSRCCQPRLTYECAIQLLNQTVKNNSVRLYALSFLDDCQDEELECFLPYLVRHSLYAPVVTR